MTLFYIGPCVRITHAKFEVRWPSHRSFAIRDLRYVHVTQDRVPVTGSVGQIRAGSTSLAGAAAVVVAAGWPILDAPAVSVVAFVVLATSSVVSGACWRVRPYSYALRATYRGELVTLFSTSDSRTFGQVKRALVRALEQLPDR